MKKWRLVKRIFFAIATLIVAWVAIEFITSSGQVAHFQAKMLWLTLSLALATLASDFELGYDLVEPWKMKAYEEVE